MSEPRPEIEETIEQWAQARLEALSAEAGEVASQFYLRAAPEPSPWSRSPGAGSTATEAGRRP